MTEISLSEVKHDHIHQTKSANADAPNVILFGWGGCQDRHLTKYSQIYLDKSCSVFRYIAPLNMTRPFSSHRDFALEFYKKVLDNDETSPIIFHVFSMNGATLLCRLWDLLDTLPNGFEIKKRVKGVIFDSSPADVKVMQSADAISFAILPPSQYSEIFRTPYKMLLAGFFALHRATVYVHAFFDPNAYETDYAYFRMQKMIDLPKKQLYLFSKADHLCSYHSIADFANQQKERGVEVHTQCWENSGHVQHLRDHPDEYAELCNKFVANAITSIDNAQNQ